MENQAEVAQEATTEAIAEDQASEATENTEGQAEGQAADPLIEDQDKKARETTAERRERRKAHERELRDAKDAALKQAEDDRRRRDRILSATGEAPVEADFADPAEYYAALGAFKYRQMSAQHDAKFIADDVTAADKRAQAAEASRLQLRSEAFAEQSVDARKRYSDFDAVLAVAGSPTIVSQDLSLMILESDASADLAYHLGKNPALAIQLSQMPPITAARELGRIEAALSIPAPKTTTKAPDPITPLNGRSSAPTKPVDQMTLSEFAAWRAAGGAPTRG